jgi:son of sevenless-like protein
VAALSSSVIERLHLTWARVERKGQLVPLQNLAQPNNNFRECRELLKSIESSCVPFIGKAKLPFPGSFVLKKLSVGMNLTDLTHIQDGYPDNIVIEPSTTYPQGLTLINFQKRQACVDIIDSILRHQSKPYKFAEKAAITAFLEQQLAIAAHEDSWFWQKSQELQQAEVAHADIKRNLEAAGF